MEGDLRTRRGICAKATFFNRLIPIWVTVTREYHSALGLEFTLTLALVCVDKPGTSVEDSRRVHFLSQVRRNHCHSSSVEEGFPLFGIGRHKGFLFLYIVVPRTKFPAFSLILLESLQFEKETFISLMVHHKALV